MFGHPSSPQRLLLMLIFIGSLVFINAVGALPQKNPPPAGPQQTGEPACEKNVPFICYANEIARSQAVYSELSGMLAGVKCPKCTPKCQIGAPLGLDEATGRWTIDCDPRPLYCKKGSTDPNCIKSVQFTLPDYGNANQMVFPHNLCSRQMIREGTCPKTLTAQIAYKPPTLGLEYVVQCDAGFTVPEILNGHARSPTTIPCIPSLYQYAGLGKDDLSDGRSMFADEDIRPSNPTAAEQWKSYKWCSPQQLGMEDCLPPPLKGRKYFIADDFEDKGTFLPAPDPSKFVDWCRYTDHHFADKACIPLDVRENGMFVKGFRSQSPPYASFLPEKDITDLNWKGTNGSAYPKKCIQATAGLAEHQLGLIRDNMFLNCATNPYYKAAADGHKARYQIVPTDCAKAEDADVGFCIEPDFDTTDTRIMTALGRNAEGLGPVHFANIAAIVTFVVGAITLFLLILKYKKFKEARLAEAEQRKTFGKFHEGSAYAPDVGWKTGWMNPFSPAHDVQMVKYNGLIRRVDRRLMALSCVGGAKGLDLEAAEASGTGAPEIPETESLDQLPNTTADTAAASPTTDSTSKPDAK